MAENKSMMLAKSVQKHAGRAKEKILQNLGKVDRTADEIFDDHLNNFQRQQASANRLQKEFNNYIRCIRAAQVASKSLMDAVCEIYEPQWTGYDALQAQSAASDSLWQDFAHKLGDQVLIPLNTYTGQFPEMKKKVEKRNRKLIDYDSQRHSFQSLQANANKRKDDVKLTQGREKLEEARRTYEILNTELHDELPALYDSRILFLVTNLQTLFATEHVFHNETAKIYSELEAIVDKLATDSQRGSNTLRKQTSNAITSSSSPVQQSKQLNNTNAANSNNYQNQITTNGGASNINSPSTSSSAPRSDSVSPTTPESSPEQIKKSNLSPVKPTSLLRGGATPATTPTTTMNEPSYQNAAAVVAGAITETTAIAAASEAELEAVSAGKAPLPESPNANTTTTTSSLEQSLTAAESETKTTKTTTTADADNNTTTKTTTTTKVAKTMPQIPTGQLNGGGNKDAANNGNICTEDSQKTALDASTADLPPGVLYRVKATYGYVKEDVDELSFEIGDIIRVIEYDDPDDQEEGWLMGQKEGTNDKGLFPANFTRPI